MQIVGTIGLHACELVFKEKLMTKGLVLVGFKLTSSQHVARRIECLFLKINHFASVVRIGELSDD